MAYILKISRSFEKDFSRLDSLTQNRVLTALEKMTVDPFGNAKKLANTAVGVFRIRIGDYRARFDVIRNEVWLYRIRQRKEVYKK